MEGGDECVPKCRHTIEWGKSYAVRLESRCALRLRYVDLVQACIDDRGQHFQQLLLVHIDFPNADLQKVFTNTIKRGQASIDAREHHFQHLL
jgi:hypothetical protein